MNQNSILCNFIFNHPNTWKEELPALSIKVKEDGVLAIFNYGIGADFSNPLIREARGIIIRLDTLEVVCWPFTKFCNYLEEAAKIDLENFDWENCFCQEKIDGSIIKLFFNPISGTWQYATNSCINAADSRIALIPKLSFLDVITQADNFRIINTENLNPEYTYIFELVSPLTQVVVRYETTHLYHTGTRNNLTGTEKDTDIGIDKPAKYPLHSLQDCIDAVELLNETNASVKKEGFVVVDRMWHRVKIKASAYFAMHQAFGDRAFSKEEVVRLLREEHRSAEDLCSDYPDYSVLFRYYAYKIAELEYDLTAFLYYARSLYAELDRDRKAFALSIKNHRFAYFAFLAINNEATAKELLNQMPWGRYLKYIPEYVPNKVI